MRMMGQAKVTEVTTSIALQAAKISYLFKLPMSDCPIYITAREQNAIVGTHRMLISRIWRGSTVL